jgi:hypothetical protein
MTLSNFKAIAKISGVELYQGLVIDGEAPPTPFALIYTARAEAHPQSGYSYIVPPEVFLNKTVPVWRLTVEDRRRSPAWAATGILSRTQMRFCWTIESEVVSATNVDRLASICDQAVNSCDPAGEIGHLVSRFLGGSLLE